MQESVNPFERLRCPGIADSEAIKEKFETITVYDDRKETVKILVADAGNGRYAFGYDIYFLNGRHAIRLPSLESGYCTSFGNAVLYFLGYIKKYGSMFSIGVINEVNRLIGEYTQTRLF
ncbi:MAG: hypothetical protein IJ328_01785 [Muribaculaceae bacterium]|nr:hypothetical protein [Muribaculaceae bacterium]